MKSSPEMSKYRQTLHLQAAKWDAKAAEGSKLLVGIVGNPALVAQVAFCREEAEKCRATLLKLRGRTKQQQRAGW